MIHFIKNNKLLIISFSCAIILTVFSTYNLLSDISEINQSRRKAVSLSERNEITAMQLEESLRDIISSSIEKLHDEESVEKSRQILSRLSELKLKISDLDEERNKVFAKGHQVQEQQKDEEERDKATSNKKNEKELLKRETQNHHHQDPPSMFGSKGSHLLEGSNQLMLLESKWNYPASSDLLRLHRMILVQSGIGARALESMCALEAWREYLDNFIKIMENRKDTMLYNWI